MNKKWHLSLSGISISKTETLTQIDHLIYQTKYQGLININQEELLIFILILEIHHFYF